MKRKRERHSYHMEWTPFYRCTFWVDGTGAKTEIPDDTVVLRNNIYTVHLEGCDVAPPMGPVAWLSIKRNDRQVIHDWRELQRIKNEIMGEECEAVEIYPAESRVHDTANQFHLWCFAPGFKLPFGYEGRFIADEKNSPGTIGGNAKQRPFNPGDKPEDCIPGDELMTRFSADPTLGTKLTHRRLKLGVG